MNIYCTSFGSPSSCTRKIAAMTAKKAVSTVIVIRGIIE